MTTASNQQEKITGRNIVVTGGTTGIGREIALTLAAAGANVLIAGQDEQHLNDALNDFQQNDGQGSLNGVIVDLATEEGINKLFEEADNKFGDKLDIMVNNAALAYQSVMDGGYEDWKRVLDTNILGYVACTRKALDRMLPESAGHIVMIGSMSSTVRETGSSIYVTTKTAINGFAETVRKEVTEKGILVTLIEPGSVNTDMQPQTNGEKEEATQKGEMLHARDIASAVTYAISQQPDCDVVEIKIRPRMQLI
jgi:NADP-dependent 3-hydroxy acid dehydrogenase YdfG